MRSGTLVRMTSIAVIGCGKIGEALVAGLTAAGVDPANVTVSNRREERSAELTERYGVTAVTDNSEAATGAEIVFLCVKPDKTLAVAEEIAETVNDNEPTSTVASMAAGVTLGALEAAMGAGAAVVRVMPNTPMTVGKGVSAIAAGRYVDDEAADAVAELLSSVGDVVRVAESDMDAVTALAGSAPAYLFLVAEALVDAGVSLGLRREAATQLAAGSVAGAGAMLEQEGADPADLRAAVSSPAGTTVAALRQLEESGLRGMFFRATEACARRSAELGAVDEEDEGSGEE